MGHLYFPQLRYMSSLIALTHGNQQMNSHNALLSRFYPYLPCSLHQPPTAITPPLTLTSHYTNPLSHHVGHAIQCQGH